MRGRRRRRRRGRKGRKGSLGTRPEKSIDVMVERSPKSKVKPAKVTRIRRRNGEVTEERYQL
jgi:hypothetical protein